MLNVDQLLQGFWSGIGVLAMSRAAGGSVGLLWSSRPASVLDKKSDGDGLGEGTPVCTPEVVRALASGTQEMVAGSAEGKGPQGSGSAQRVVERHLLSPWSLGPPDQWAWTQGVSIAGFLAATQRNWWAAASSAALLSGHGRIALV